jgi:phenylalanyl-tRNA synthetase beta chain
VCQVDVGLEAPYQIVCGATNHKEGDKVCAALPGCVLPGDFKIKKSKIRGVESSGMLCSDKEMNLSSESEGIRILDQDAPIGASVPEYLNLSETIFEISVTPNRADCLSHWGLAREISCLIDKPLKSQEPNIKHGKTVINNRFRIEVKNNDLCPRFMGRWIENVKVRPSPNWLKLKLERAGFNSINNIVDITNYVMLELGQPMHAYDFTFIEGQEIHVSKSIAGEKFKSFDGSEYTLTGEELTIRDKTKVLGLAGVVGSKDSGVNDDTVNIFLECAYFLPSSVRKTARRFGIETDAAYRFSRGTDIDMIPRAINLACEMMADLADGVVAKDIFDYYPQPLTRPKIKIKVSDITERLGFEATEKQFEYWLEHLSCEFTKSPQEGYTVFPPAFRYDMTLKEDLIEEYGRLEGYDQIPEILPEMSTDPQAHDPVFLKSRFVTQALFEQGFSQVINYNFASGDEQKSLISNIHDLKIFNIGHDGDNIKVRNPISDKLDSMRSLLFPQLFQNAIHNFKHGRSQGQLFENGSVFFKKDILKEGVPQTTYKEEFRTAAILWGETHGYWENARPNASYSVFKLKSHLEALLNKANVKGYRFEDQSSNPNINFKPPEFLHPGQWSCLFVRGKYVGVIGTVHPKLLEEAKFREPMAYFELNMDMITQDIQTYNKVQSLAYYPMVKRDLTFELDQKVQFKDIHRVVNKVSGSLFKSLDIKDIYRGERLGPNKMALTVTLFLQDQEKPIEDKVLDQVQDKIFKSIATEFQ